MSDAYLSDAVDSPNSVHLLLVSVHAIFNLLLAIVFSVRIVI